MADPVLLADAISTLQQFVNTLFLVYLVLIFAYILSSWVQLPYGIWIDRVQRFLSDVVTPYLRLFRRFLPQLSFGGVGLDLSPIVAIFGLYLLNRIIQDALELLH